MEALQHARGPDVPRAVIFGKCLFCVRFFVDVAAAGVSAKPEMARGWRLRLTGRTIRAVFGLSLTGECVCSLRPSGWNMREFPQLSMACCCTHIK